MTATTLTGLTFVTPAGVVRSTHRHLKWAGVNEYERPDNELAAALQKQDAADAAALRAEFPLARLTGVTQTVMAVLTGETCVGRDVSVRRRVDILVGRTPSGQVVAVLDGAGRRHPIEVDEDRLASTDARHVYREAIRAAESITSA